MNEIKAAVIEFYSGNITVVPCDGIEILPGQIRLMDAKGNVKEYYRSAFVRNLMYDGKEFPLLKKGKER